MFSKVQHHATGNRLIDRLPEVEARRLISHAERVELPQGETLYRQYGPISHLYFPISGCCCHIVPLDEGRQIEATTIGKEGMLGIHRALGLAFSPFMVVSVVPGDAMRIPVRCYLELAGAGGSLDSLIKRYAAYCLSFASQAIACNTIHNVEQRVCRRLLMAHDRVGRDEFPLTQELLGQLLGVRRQSITQVASMLQEARFISYRRGAITVLNRRGLESASCECYKIATAAYDSIVTN